MMNIEVIIVGGDSAGYTRPGCWRKRVLTCLLLEGRERMGAYLAGEYR